MAGFCLQPIPVLAQDQDTGKPDTKDADAGPKKDADAGPKAVAEKPAATEQVQKADQQGDASLGDKPDRMIKPDSTIKSDSTTKADNTSVDDRSTDITKQPGKVAQQSDKQTGQDKSQQKHSTSVVVQGTEANHYNNQWVAASTHSDWDVSINHSWNNHEYRYYDGGWLIIETSEPPAYYESDALVIRVKQSLAQQGYYTGHLTGTVGPHTRLAISNYESANGLQVNGQIDGPLLVSLGLE
jgi:hypothetical protein